MDTIAINLFAGPGSGKSTLRAEVFAKLKWAGVVVEEVTEVTEVAKDIVWDETTSLFKDPLYVFAEQWHRMERLRGKVSHIITDSPTPISIVHNHLYGVKDESLDRLMWDRFNSFVNINIFLVRTKPYVKIGRYQDESGARHIDDLIRAELIVNDVPFSTVIANEQAAEIIVAIIDEHVSH
jgi:hypothetical protein